MKENASLMKRLAACLYESLSLIAIWLLSTFVYMLVFGDVDTDLKRHMLQMTLWLVAGVYFVTCWVRTGQTLAMQAWKIKLTQQDGRLLSLSNAALRYVLASVSLGLFGLGFLWAVVDREQRFLHDRLLNTWLRQLTTH